MKNLEFDFIVRRNIDRFLYLHKRKVDSRVTVDRVALMYLIKMVFNYKISYDGRKQTIPFVSFDNL